MVAGERAMPKLSTSVLEPSGRPVATYSRTMRRRINRCRSLSGSSSVGVRLAVVERLVLSLTACSRDDLSTLALRVLIESLLHNITSRKGDGRPLPYLTGC